MSYIFIDKNTMVNSDEISVIKKELDPMSGQESLRITVGNRDYPVDIPLEALLTIIQRAQAQGEDAKLKQFISV